MGGKSAAKLHAHGILTVGEVAELPEGLLVSLLGKAAGHKLHALAHNRDPRRVVRGTRRRSIGSQRALGRRGARTLAALDPTVLAIIDRLGRRLRKAERLCRTLVLRLRFDDFARATRSVTLPAATAHTPTLLAAARELLVTSMPLVRERGLTLIGYSLTNLTDIGGIQLVLPLDRRLEGRRPVQGFPDGTRSLDLALDEVRERFGSRSITRAVLLGRDTGFSMPHLPD